MARSNAVMKRVSTGSGRNAVHIWTDISGIENPVELDMGKVSDMIADRLMDHGAYAKIGDAAAKSDSTTAEKFAGMRKVLDALIAGEWRGEREPSDLDLIEAILENGGDKLTREKVTADLRKMSSAEKSVLRVFGPIKKILDKNAATAAKKSAVDPAAILAKFIHG